MDGLVQGLVAAAGGLETAERERYKTFREEAERMNGGLDKSELVRGLRSLGIEDGDEVLVHSSLKSLGFVEGGPQTVVDALVEAVGRRGTVLVPTLTGSRELGPEHPPVFDPDDTPCWTGIIPETFRKDPRARRSLHPTHSVAAIGPAAEELLRDHEKSPSPCGRETPYLRLASGSGRLRIADCGLQTESGNPQSEIHNPKSRGGRVLFIGVNMSCCTVLHGVEEAAELPYQLQCGVTRARITVGGREKEVAVRLHYYGPKRNFRALEPLLAQNGFLRSGGVGRAQCLLVECRGLVELALAKVREDPEFLLDESEKGKGWGTSGRPA